jgi:hypothetical protein
VGLCQGAVHGYNCGIATGLLNANATGTSPHFFTAISSTPFDIVVAELEWLTTVTDRAISKII